MKQFVRVISVRYDCAAKPARHPHEPLDTYVTRLQNHLLEHLHEAVSLALYAVQAEHDEADARRMPVTFVTAPEFYWNVPWHALHDLRDVHELPALQIGPVCDAIAEVAEQFPAWHFGHIVFLPGTAAMLFEVPRPPRQTAGRAQAAPHGALFESLNYVYATTNFLPPFDAGDDAGLRRAIVWPKHHTSRIDYGLQTSESADAGSRTFQLADGSPVEVLKESAVAPHGTTAPHAPGAGRYGARMAEGFDNRLDGVPPFGIDICRDYLLWRNAPSPRDAKAPHLAEPRYVIDFVPSYGVNITDVAFPVPPSLQYIVHNDGRAARQVVVFEVNRTRLRWNRVAPARCMRHLGAAAGEQVAIHEFTVDVPGQGGAQ